MHCFYEFAVVFDLLHALLENCKMTLTLATKIVIMFLTGVWCGYKGGIGGVKVGNGVNVDEHVRSGFSSAVTATKRTLKISCAKKLIFVVFMHKKVDFIVIKMEYNQL